MTDAMQRLSEAVGNVRDVVVQQATRRMEELEQAPEFNPVVFWSVNAIWITVLAVLVIWLWKFNGAERLQRWTRAHANRDSDQELAARLRRRREQEEESKKISPEEHAEMLGKTFREKKVHMIVKPIHFVRDSSAAFVASPSAQEDLDLECASEASGAGLLVLPQNREDGTRRRVPNCCAVCLGPYSPGDSVVWSSNPECQHAFHEDCVTDWLVKMQGDHPCPCCRQTFVETPVTKKEKKISWEAGRSMNLNAISL